MERDELEINRMHQIIAELRQTVQELRRITLDHEQRLVALE